MNREEIEKMAEDTFGILFRMQEQTQCQIYQIIHLLIDKGIITKEEYDKYLSIEAIDKIMNNINEALKEEEN